MELLKELCKTVPQGRLVKAVSHRWVSAAHSMECYLVYYPGLLAIFAQQEDKQLTVKDEQEVGSVNLLGCFRFVFFPRHNS